MHTYINTLKMSTLSATISQLAMLWESSPTYVIIDHKGHSKATDTTKSRVQHEISVG